METGKGEVFGCLVNCCRFARVPSFSIVSHGRRMFKCLERVALDNKDYLDSSAERVINRIAEQDGVPGVRHRRPYHPNPSSC